MEITLCIICLQAHLPPPWSDLILLDKIKAGKIKSYCGLSSGPASYLKTTFIAPLLQLYVKTQMSSWASLKAIQMRLYNTVTLFG